MSSISYVSREAFQFKLVETVLDLLDWEDILDKISVVYPWVTHPRDPRDPRDNAFDEAQRHVLRAAAVLMEPFDPVLADGLRTVAKYHDDYTSLTFEQFMVRHASTEDVKRLYRGVRGISFCEWISKNINKPTTPEQRKMFSQNE